MTHQYQIKKTIIKRTLGFNVLQDHWLNQLTKIVNSLIDSGIYSNKQVYMISSKHALKPLQLCTKS